MTTNANSILKIVCLKNILEPDVFPAHLNITGAKLAKDLAVFYDLLHSSKYGYLFKNSRLYGPDVTGPWYSPIKYLRE